MKFLMKIEDMMDTGRWILAGLSGFVAAVPELTHFLVILMLVDVVFGLAAARKQRNLSPVSMWEGVTKKIGSLGIVVLAAIIDGYVDVLGIDLVQVTTVFYIGPELLSILRNAALLGVAVPPQFSSVLKYFSDQEKQAKPDENKSVS